MRLVELADAAIERLTQEHNELAAQRGGSDSSALAHRPAAVLDLFNCRVRHGTSILQGATAAEILDCTLPPLTSKHLDIRAAFAADGMLNQRVVSAAGQHLWAFLLLFAYAEQLRRPYEPSTVAFLLRTLEGIDTATLRFARRLLIRRDPLAVSRRGQPQEPQSSGQLVDGLLQLVAADDHAPSALSRVRRAMEQYGEWAAAEADDQGPEVADGRRRASVGRRHAARGSAGAGVRASAVDAAVAASAEFHAVAAHGKRQVAGAGAQHGEAESAPRFKRPRPSGSRADAGASPTPTSAADLPSPVRSASPALSSSSDQHATRPSDISCSPPILSPASAADLQLAAAAALPHAAAAASVGRSSPAPQLIRVSLHLSQPHRTLFCPPQRDWARSLRLHRVLPLPLAQLSQFPL